MAIISRTSSNEVALLPTNLDLRLYRGDSFDIVFKLKTAERAGVDLSGWVGIATITDVSNNIAARPTVFTNYSGEIGLVRLFLTDTSGFPVGTFRYTVQLTDGDGRKRTFLAGTITIVGDN